MSHELSHQSTTAGRSKDRGQIMLGCLITLAIIASIIMIVTDSSVAFKIALLCSLWAAAIGFLLVFRYRKQLQDAAEELVTLESLHEAELEVALAEQEMQKLKVKEELQSQVAADRELIASIKEELEKLRTQLTDLTNREWAYEPQVLRAEARRILELESEEFFSVHKGLEHGVSTAPAESVAEPEEENNEVVVEEISDEQPENPTGEIPLIKQTETDSDPVEVHYPVTMDSPRYEDSSATTQFSAVPSEKPQEQASAASAPEEETTVTYTAEPASKLASEPIAPQEESDQKPEARPRRAQGGRRRRDGQRNMLTVAQLLAAQKKEK